MKFYIKSIRDTATGTVFINQPETCPAELEPYRLKHLPGMAECVQEVKPPPVKKLSSLKGNIAL